MVFPLYSTAYTMNKGSIMKYFNYFEQMSEVRELLRIFCCLTVYRSKKLYFYLGTKSETWDRICLKGQSRLTRTGGEVYGFFPSS